MPSNSPVSAGLVRAMLLTASLAFAARAAAQGVGPHLGVGVLAGDAPGLDDGYVHFGGFVPLVQQDAESVVFADAGLLLFNEGTDYLGGYAGVGSRAYCDHTGTILGGYAYYDRRDLGLAEFDQIGLGVESLGELFDARLQVNTPVGERLEPTGAGKAAALTTIDGEVGALLTEHFDTQLRAFVGVYGLFHDRIDDTAGVRGRVEARVADQWFVGGYVEHDDLFDTTGGVTFEYRFGRGPSDSERSTSNLLARLGDPVVRRRHVLVANTAAGPSLLSVVPDGGPDGPSGPGGPTTTPDGGVDDTPGRPYTPPVRDDL